MSTAPRLSFTVTQFISQPRRDELALVTNVIDHIDDPDQPRTVVFHKEIGSGKTWLVLYLKREVLSHLFNVTTLFVSFGKPFQDSSLAPGEYVVDEKLYAPDASPDELARGVLAWIAQQDSINASTSPTGDLIEQTGLLVNAIREKFKERVLVLIFDSIFEVDWTKLAKLENALLAPLAALPRVVMVLTGRGRMYPWESPYLRVNVAPFKSAEGEFIPLRPFTSLEVATQLQLLKQTLSPSLPAETIHQLGGGYPWINYLLAMGGNEPAATRIAREGLLDVIPEERKAQVSRDLEALCVLQGFRESEMPKMWAAYDDRGNGDEMSKAEIRMRRDHLLDTYFMHWRDGRFVIDEPIRRVLESYLKTNDLKRWERLQRRAKQLYETWAKDFQKYEKHFQDQAAYHARQLAAVQS